MVVVVGGQDGGQRCPYLRCSAASVAALWSVSSLPARLRVARPTERPAAAAETTSMLLSVSLRPRSDQCRVRHCSSAHAHSTRQPTSATELHFLAEVQGRSAPVITLTPPYSCLLVGCRFAGVGRGTEGTKGRGGVGGGGDPQSCSSKCRSVTSSRSSSASASQPLNSREITSARAHQRSRARCRVFATRNHIVSIGGQLPEHPTPSEQNKHARAHTRQQDNDPQRH